MALTIVFEGWSYLIYFIKFVEKRGSAAPLARLNPLGGLAPLSRANKVRKNFYFLLSAREHFLILFLVKCSESCLEPTIIRINLR